MSLFNSVFARVALAVVVGVAVALACGPFFGIEALDDRKAVLLASPTISFERELSGLVPQPKDKLLVVESNGYGTEEVTSETVEAKELTPTIAARVKEMRKQIGGEAAYAAGEGVPEGVRQYAAGAVSFRFRESDAARTHFQAVLTLAAPERKSREVWAHYMLGRATSDPAEAIAQFQATRSLVTHGAADPLGLAVASFGEEALRVMEQGDLPKAVALYAQQAAYGSQSGQNSLVTIAGRILKDKDLLDKAIQDPLTRRLLFICVNGNNGRTFFIGPNVDDDTTAADQSTVDRIAAALERAKLTRVEGAGLLAAAAYHQGRFDLADQLARFEDVPISAWVKAKLALRRGDRAAALGAFEKALKGFAAADDSDTNETLRVLRSETGVLKVSRGDYLQALDLFRRAAAGAGEYGFPDYWGDVAYLAERVLTIDELRGYVDKNVPPVTQAKPEEQPDRMQLRSLLARRMMRAGRFHDALRYFDDKETRAAAELYGKAVDTATGGWRFRWSRAEGWFGAATVARAKGMEVLGYERAPDYAMWDGNFEPYEVRDGATKHERLKDAFETEDERKRVAATRPEHTERYQYRMTAVDEAMNAADLLPEKSQAFAAVLCAASGWVIDRYPERAHEVYERYVRNGAHVPWAKGFGRTCPAPNFEIDSVYGVTRRAKRWERRVKGHPLYAGLGGVGLLAVPVVLGYLVWWRRRRGPTSQALQ